MPRLLHTPAEVQRCVDGGAQVVDVLPKAEYEEMHLAGAISIPLRRIETDAPDRLDVTKAVVVYCWDAA